MYLHLGQDYIVPLQSVVAVFDMDTATASKRTRLLLERLQDEGQIIELYDDLPRAAVLCENALGETLFLTQLSPQAIQRRAEKGYARVGSAFVEKYIFSTKRICRVYADISQGLRKVPPDG